LTDRRAWRGDDRLRAQVGPGLRQPADRHFERRTGAQCVALIGVGIAGGNHQRPTADHLGQTMLHPLGHPRVLNAAGQALGQAEPRPLDLGQHQTAASEVKRPL
jgi:hypothetical protein